MPCDTPNYQCTGVGSALLPFPSLKYILTSEPVVGSGSDQIPDGPVNRELHKLLMNVCALSTFVTNYFSKTYGTSGSVAPAVDTIPVPLAGAPSSPVNGVVHVVYYTDYEVTYQRDGENGVWVEISRQARVMTVATVYKRKLEIAITTGEDNLAFDLPTETDDETEFEFTIDDLKGFYVLNLDEEAPFIGVVLGINEGEAAVRMALTDEPEDGSDYKLVVLFERTVLN